MGEVTAARGQLGLGREYFMDSIKLLTESKVPMDLAEAHEAFGDLLARNGQIREARTQWLNAGRLFDLIGANSKAQRISSILQQTSAD